MKTNRLDPIDRVQNRWLDAISAAQEPLREFTRNLLNVPGTPDSRSAAGESPRSQSGRLRDSIYVDLNFNAETISVTSSSPYWQFLDAGTGVMEARPISGPIRTFGRNLILQEFRKHGRNGK